MFCTYALRIVLFSWLISRVQAYDGHMNLILSDVEETIMIVEVVDGQPDVQGTVNVCADYRTATDAHTGYR